MKVDHMNTIQSLARLGWHCTLSGKRQTCSGDDFIIMTKNGRTVPALCPPAELSPESARLYERFTIRRPSYVAAFGTATADDCLARIAKETNPNVRRKLQAIFDSGPEMQTMLLFYNRTI